MDENIQEQPGQVEKYRATAEVLGDAALEAMQRGDIGMARTAARQAAQWARVVMQLETGEKQVWPDEEGAIKASPAPLT